MGHRLNLCLFGLLIFLNDRILCSFLFYFSGSYECKLCLTLHNNEGSYLAHTQGKKHQANLARRASKDAKDSPQQVCLILSYFSHNFGQICLFCHSGLIIWLASFQVLFRGVFLHTVLNYILLPASDQNLGGLLLQSVACSYSTENFT